MDRARKHQDPLSPDETRFFLQKRVSGARTLAEQAAPETRFRRRKRVSFRWRAALCLFLVLVASGPSTASASESVDVHSLSTTAATYRPVSSDEETRPVAVPPATTEAIEYHRTGNALWLFSQAWSLAILALWLGTGASARVRTFSAHLGRNLFGTTAIYGVLFLAINSLIDLPLDYYYGFVRPHAYHLSNQTLAKWTGDHFKALGVSLVTTPLLLWIPYFLLRRSPRRWWLYTGVLLVPLMFFFMMILPIWYDPLFNHYGPMKDKALEAKILAEAQRAGIDSRHVFEVDKSRDTNTLNAYVKGFLGTKRIVLWDTLLNQLDEREVLVVMGHEMGHYVLGHVVRSLLLASVLNFVALFLAHRIGLWLLARQRGRLGFDRLADVASVPLFLLIFQVLTLVGLPAVNLYSRHQEHEADRFALELTHMNHAGAMAFVKMQERNLSVPYPSPLYRIFRGTHPSVGDRIEFCNTYRPWQHGEPLAYEAYFPDNTRPRSTTSSSARAN